MTMTVLLDLLVIALVTAVAWAGPLLARPTLPFGVRVPAARAEDPAILEHRTRHGHRVLALGAIAAVSLLGWWLWTGWVPGPELILLPMLGAGIACGLLAAREVRKTKRDNDFDADTRRVATADLGLRTNPVRLPWPWLAPAILLTGATALLHSLTPGATFAPVLAQLLLIALVLLVAAGILRARPEIEPERPVGSARRYRRYLHRFTRLLLASAALANLTVLAHALSQWGILPAGGWFTALGYLPLALALAAWLHFSIRVGEAGHRLPAEPGEQAPMPVRRDDDRHWHLAGMIYLNRRDPAVLVHRRAGLFWTLNLGHPLAWTAATAVLVLAALTSLGVLELPSRS
ncbi:hypothetical protein [Crossiella cryophila]|uniref:DUF5808 domain-containing protein n=1 Tax=Crossiella cryophila TaxID=43355 RepID=A0A7W7CBQ2_9PSEU|nr:hypothetical protein [Crossiella cryophila]MBB4678222.1 hypothetical protein [Crossiella cryophila]